MYHTQETSVQLCTICRKPYTYEVTPMNTNESIDKTRKSFETSFAEKKYYDVQTYDDEHLQRIMNALDIQEDYKVLDLGTGNGFLAFPLAERFPDSKITGLDIVPETLDRNVIKARDQNIENLDFACYHGVELPFEDETFDVIVTRYCFHHCPEAAKTFTEIARVLKPGGQFFISDPTPNDNDEARFVDSFMKLKDDGHIRLYKKEEFVKLGEDAGLVLEGGFNTGICFPRKIAEGYRQLADSADKNVTGGYEIQITDTEVYITLRVLNLSFRKAVV